MIALKITHIKQFMAKFLAGEDFDSFLLEEASISTYNTFMIDGHQNRDFYSTEEWEDKELRPYELSAWKKIRPICFELIRGKRTPAAFRFVLHLIPGYAEALLQKNDIAAAKQVQALILNIKYDGTTLMLVTGISFHTFLMDKTPDTLWDNAVRQFLAKHEISYEEL